MTDRLSQLAHLCALTAAAALLAAATQASAAPTASASAKPVAKGSKAPVKKPPPKKAPSGVSSGAAAGAVAGTAVMTSSGGATPVPTSVAPPAPGLLVEQGSFPCFDNKTVTISQAGSDPNVFTVAGGGKSYTMIATQTSTGTVRLEDKSRGGLWLQLGNKSMLMDTRLGQRVADDCTSARQRAVGEQIQGQPGLLGK